MRSRGFHGPLEGRTDRGALGPGPPPFTPAGPARRIWAPSIRRPWRGRKPRCGRTIMKSTIRACSIISVRCHGPSSVLRRWIVFELHYRRRGRHERFSRPARRLRPTQAPPDLVTYYRLLCRPRPSRSMCGKRRVRTGLAADAPRGDWPAGLWRDRGRGGGADLWQEQGRSSRLSAAQAESRRAGGRLRAQKSPGPCRGF
jgi:hypothetical protein